MRCLLFYRSRPATPGGARVSCPKKTDAMERRHQSQEHHVFKAVEMMDVRRGLLSILAVTAIGVVGCGGGTSAGGNAGGNNTGGPYGAGPGYGGNPAGDISTSSKSGIGKYLVTAEGRTLYYFALDVP